MTLGPRSFPALALGISLLGCGAGPEPGATVNVPRAVEGASSGSADRPAPKRRPARTSSIPPDPTSCKLLAPKPESFAPTSSELQAFLEALSDAECADAAAVTACAGKAGPAGVELAFGKDDAPHACTLSLRNASFGARRFMVATKFFRDGATFFSMTHVHELRGGRAVLYLEGDTGQSVPCGAQGTMGIVSPEAKKDWATLPANLRELFCKGA